MEEKESADKEMFDKGTTLKFDDYVFHKDIRGTYIVNIPPPGRMPSISIHAKNIPSAWELAVLSCWEYGASVHTHYDKKDATGNYIDPASKEATMEVHVDDPFNEPRIHKNFPGGPEELEAYRQEVVEGIHDHWIDPLAGKWTYTYHERMFDYNPSINLRSKDRGLLLPKGVNQIEKIIDDLQRDITSKGSQAITWMPTADPGLESNRPCLQRLWFRVLEDEKGEAYLNLNSHWRSRDLYKAWFMNVYAITDLQKNITEKLSKKIGREIKVGSYIDICDSLHIYGSYWKEQEFQTRIKQMSNPDLSKRTWTSDSPAFAMMTQEAREKLAKDPDWYKKGKG